jgi:hypothetical protein
MSESTAAAPVIPLATLLPLLSEHCLSARAARILEPDEHFQILQFRSHRIYYVHNFVTSNLSLQISISALARALIASATALYARSWAVENLRKRGDAI